jgi:15-cis-phytoene desaturase
VYAAIPGRNKYRPSQATPISNFTLAGDWTSQKFLGSMEGAVLAGKLAAEVVTDKAVYGASTKGLKKIMPDVIAEAKTLSAKEPVGAIDGESAVAYGAGAVMTETEEKELAAIDPDQMVKLDAYSAAPAR